MHKVLMILKYFQFQPDGIKLHPRDPRWVGAWWLGYFIFSWFLLLSGVFLLCFPKEMPKFRVKRNEALKEGNILEADEDIGKSMCFMPL